MRPRPPRRHSSSQHRPAVGRAAPTPARRRCTRRSRWVTRTCGQAAPHAASWAARLCAAAGTRWAPASAVARAQRHRGRLAGIQHLRRSSRRRTTTAPPPGAATSAAERLLVRRGSSREGARTAESRPSDFLFHQLKNNIESFNSTIGSSLILHAKIYNVPNQTLNLGFSSAVATVRFEIIRIDLWAVACYGRQAGNYVEALLQRHCACTEPLRAL